MKFQISSVDLHYIVKELQLMIGSRVDRIYNPEKEDVLIQAHLTGVGKKIIRILSGKAVFLTNIKETSEEPSGFCMFLRKYLENTRIREISQIASERILLIVFEGKETNYKLYAELFGKGNIVFTDENDIIINAIDQKKWSDRDIKKGLKYEYPKREFNLFKINREEFEKIIKSGKKDIGFTLAKELGVGGTFSDEIISMSGIDKTKKEISQAEIDSIYDSFLKIITNDIRATAIYDNEELRLIAPFKLSSMNELRQEEIESMSQGFDIAVKSQAIFKSKHQNLIDKTGSIVYQQRTQVEELMKSAEEEQKKGEMIYENYQKVEEILRVLNEARKKYSFDEIKNKLGGNGIVTQVDSKNKKIKINL